MPAIASTLLGTFAAEWLLSGRSRRQLTAGLAGAGVVGLALGELWNLVFPINKNLWTSSFVVFTAGFAALVLAICYWLVDVKGWRRPGRPFEFFGVNPLALYVASEAVAMGAMPSIRHWSYERVAAAMGNPQAASLALALAYLAPWWVVAWIMYRKAIYIKL